MRNCTNAIISQFKSQIGYLKFLTDSILYGNNKMQFHIVQQELH